MMLVYSSLTYNIKSDAIFNYITMGVNRHNEWHSMSFIYYILILDTLFIKYYMLYVWNDWCKRQKGYIGWVVKLYQIYSIKSPLPWMYMIEGNLIFFKGRVQKKIVKFGDFVLKGGRGSFQKPNFYIPLNWDF